MVDSTWTPLKLVLETPGDNPWIIGERIFHILNTYLQPNNPDNVTGGTLSAANAAAQEIDKLFPLNRPKEKEKDDIENEEPGSFLWEMWEIVISVAQQIPWKHPGQTKLVEFIQALKDLPEPKTRTVRIGDYWPGEVTLWSDLPILGPVMTECGHAIDLEDTSSSQKSIRIRQRNFVAFSARLTQSGLADRAEHFSIHYFRAAFEVEPDKRAKAYHKQGPGMDVYVPLAVMWLFLCGNVIFAHCRRSSSSSSNQPGTGRPRYNLNDAGRNWKGANGFSIDRWNFWKKRIGEIKDHDQASEKTKKVAVAGERLMNRIESEAVLTC